MANQSLFDKLEAEAFRRGLQARTKDSMEWFQGYLKGFKDLNPAGVQKDSRMVPRQRFGVGNMYMYRYDPKGRETLPYYDIWPLTIMVGPAPGGFYGLNVHYLPPALRARLFDALLDTRSNNKFNENTKFNIDYQILKSVSKLKYYKPCFKHYLRKHVDSKIVMVQPADWEIAMFLPTETFKKAGKRRVWADSRKMI